MTVLGVYSEGRDNNFNLIRIVAAVMVMIPHSLLLAGWPVSQDPLVRLIGVDSGTVAVNTFFAISGFLIAGSFCRNKSLLAYLESRFLRIFPGLWVSVLLSAFVLGGLFTSLTLRDYYSSRQLWEFVGVNSTLILDKILLRFTLPGVFSSNPTQYTVNGSLWTLPYEVWMYIALMGVGVIGLLKKKRTFNLLVFATLLTWLLIRYVLNGNPYLHKLGDLERFGSYFLAGVFAYVNRDKVPLNTLLVVSLVILTVLFQGAAFFNVLFFVTLVYLIFWIAFVPSGWVRNYNKLGDYSYGTYIYAFPIQQSLVSLFPGIDPLRLFIAAFGVTLFLAVLSWHFIENPALKRKGNLFKSRSRDTVIVTQP